jgi:hypothetical protein
MQSDLDTANIKFTICFLEIDAHRVVLCDKTNRVLPQWFIMLP